MGLLFPGDGRQIAPMKLPEPAWTYAQFVRGRFGRDVLAAKPLQKMADEPRPMAPSELLVVFFMATLYTASPELPTAAPPATGGFRRGYG